MPLCADSKLYYEKYRPYSLIDGELATTTESEDSSALDQQTSDAEQLMFTDDSKYEDISSFVVLFSLFIFQFLCLFYYQTCTHSTQ